MLRYLTAGESHGRALVVILEGVPAGLLVTAEDIQRGLARRRLGFGRGPRMRFEVDEVSLMAGIRHGRTLGSPIAIEIANTEWPKWEEEMSPAPGLPSKVLTQPRPGHADLAGMLKYGLDDARDVLERASARETAARVAAGTVAKLLLAQIGVDVLSHIVQMGKARAHPAALPRIEDLAAIDGSQVRCFDAKAEKRMVAAIKAAAKAGDSLGGVAEVIAYGVPVGLGSHVHWDRRLDALLAQALMSIQAIKAVEIGEGAEVAAMLGSEAHDAIRMADPGAGPDETATAAMSGGYVRDTHRAGGIEGGHEHRRTDRGPPVDEAAGHPQPADAGHRGRGHQGGDRVVQGAHRRDRGARHGRRRRDDDRPRVGRGGAAEVRWGLGRGVHPELRRLPRHPGRLPVGRGTAGRWLSRLVLIGMMGTGKTTVGRELAGRLGWAFLDSDAMVEASTGSTVKELFAERGEDGFRSEESAGPDRGDGSHPAGRGGGRRRCGPVRGQPGPAHRKGDRGLAPRRSCHLGRPARIGIGAPVAG